MSKEVNGVLLKHLFQLAEEDKQNDRFLDLFDKSVKSIDLKPSSISLEFHNGISVLINNSFDNYYMYISDPEFYDNEDTAYSPMGYDRVIRYLKNICQFKYNWRK